MSLPPHITACFCTSLWSLSSPLFSFQMEGQQNVRPPPGTTEWNHSYFTGNSLSAPHSVQQLQNGMISTSVQPLAYTQETNGAASPGFVSSPLLPRSAISSQVPAGPTRNVTGEVMPLAEAVTQLSFLEFLQRCGLLSCSSSAASATSPHFTPGRWYADDFTQCCLSGCFCADVCSASFFVIS